MLRKGCSTVRRDVGATHASPLRLSAANALLAILLGATPLSAHAEGDSLFIQGSEVNIRTSPNTQANIVAKLPIATACQWLADASKDDWVKVRCGKTEGFTLKSLLGPEEPQYDAILAQAKDKTRPTKERFDAAMRAAALKPEDEEALKWLHDLYLDSEFEVLAEDRKQGNKEKFQVQTMRACPKDTNCLSSDYIAAGLAAEFKNYRSDWFAVEVRKSDFVVALARDGLVSVFRGASLGNTNDIDTYRVDSQASFKASPALLAALTSASTQGSKEEAWQMPTDRNVLERLREMPSAWFLVSDDRKCVYRRHGHYGWAILLRRSFVGHLLRENSQSDSDREFDTRKRAIIAIRGRKPRSHFVMSPPSEQSIKNMENLDDTERAERLAELTAPEVLTWPTAEDNIAQWQQLGSIDASPFTSQPDGMAICKGGY